MQVVDPATGTLGPRYEAASVADAERALDEARRAWPAWRDAGIDRRAASIGRLAAVLRRHAGSAAELMAREMGKPIGEGRAEIEKCAWLCDHLAAHGAMALASTPVSTDARESYVAYRPLGVVLAVMPWNFPFWQVLRCAAPALLAGNAVVLKHAANVPGCALAVDAYVREAGIPPDVFRTVLIESEHVGALIAHPAVAGVAVTGSVATGRAVARAAGEHLKKSVLELGGSDAYVVLADADIARAAATSAKSRLINGGQSCIAAKRFIVERSVLAEFEAAFTARMAEARIGDPLDPATTLGPLARVDLRDELHRQVERSVSLGATVRLGGAVPARPGAWYPPTVMTGVRPGMPAFDEELFGPVGAIVPADDAADAIRLANATRFGLGGAIFTADVERGRALAEHGLEAGACFVNDLVRSDPRMPFGGVKESGYGRELGEIGLREFVNAKTVWVG